MTLTLIGLVWSVFICQNKCWGQLESLNEDVGGEDLRSELVLLCCELLDPFVGVHTETIFVTRKKFKGKEHLQSFSKNLDFKGTT